MFKSAPINNVLLPEASRTVDVEEGEPVKLLTVMLPPLIPVRVMLDGRVMLMLAFAWPEISNLPAVAAGLLPNVTFPAPETMLLCPVAGAKRMTEAPPVT